MQDDEIAVMEKLAHTNRTVFAIVAGRGPGCRLKVQEGRGHELCPPLAEDTSFILNVTEQTVVWAEWQKPTYEYCLRYIIGGWQGNVVEELKELFPHRTFNP